MHVHTGPPTIAHLKATVTDRRRESGHVSTDNAITAA